MSRVSTRQALLAVALLALPLGACVAGSANPSSQRATELATLVSRASACRAASPRANTLERFIASERARGASDEQVAAARSAYVGISEADMVNQALRPEGCTAEERAALKADMARIRAGDFGGL